MIYVTSGEFFVGKPRLISLMLRNSPYDASCYFSRVVEKFPYDMLIDTCDDKWGLTEPE